MRGKVGNDKAELIVSSGNNASNLLVSSNEKLSFQRTKNDYFRVKELHPSLKTQRC